MCRSSASGSDTTALSSINRNRSLSPRQTLDAIDARARKQSTGGSGGSRGLSTWLGLDEKPLPPQPQHSPYLHGPPNGGPPYAVPPAPVHTGPGNLAQPLRAVPPPIDEELEAALRASELDYAKERRRFEAARERELEEAAMVMAASHSEEQAAERARALREQEAMAIEREVYEQSLIEAQEQAERQRWDEEQRLRQALERSEAEAIDRKAAEDMDASDSDLSQAIALSLSLAEHGQTSRYVPDADGAGPSTAMPLDARTELRVLGPGGLSTHMSEKQRLLAEMTARDEAEAALSRSRTRRGPLPPLPIAIASTSTPPRASLSPAPSPALNQHRRTPSPHNLIAEISETFNSAPSPPGLQDDPFDDHNEVDDEMPESSPRRTLVAAHARHESDPQAALRPSPERLSVPRRTSAPIPVPPAAVGRQPSTLAPPMPTRPAPPTPSRSSSFSSRVSPGPRPSESADGPKARFGYLGDSLRSSWLEQLPDVARLSLLEGRSGADAPRYSIFSVETATLRGLLRFLTWHGDARIEANVTDLERTKGTKPYPIALSIVTRPNAVRLDVEMLPIDAARAPKYATGGNQRRFGVSALQQLPISLALLATVVLDVSRQAQRAHRDEPLGRLALEIEKRANEAGEDIARERVQEGHLLSRMKARIRGEPKERERDGIPEAATMITPFDLSQFG